MSNNEDLLDYFIWLSAQIADERINNERDLDVVVCVPRFDLAFGKTLLQRLGYDSSSAQPQYRVRFATTAYPVDFLLGMTPNVWMLEIKAPTEHCENPTHVRQLQDYMTKESVPLGVLFNGREAHFFINPSHRAFQAKSYRDHIGTLNRNPVTVVRIDNINQMAGRFADLRAGLISEGVVTVAKRLLRKFVEQQKGAKRRKEIRAEVQRLREQPDETILRAVSETPRLQDLNATIDEVRDAWTSQYELLPTAKSLAERVRVLASLVCQKVGYETLKAHGIRGLSMRIGEDKQKGYYLVPNGADVPDGLAVRNMDASTAARVASSLEALLK